MDGNMFGSDEAWKLGLRFIAGVIVGFGVMAFVLGAWLF